MAAERYLSRRIPDLRVGNNIDEIDKKLIPASISIHPWFGDRWPANSGIRILPPLKKKNKIIIIKKNIVKVGPPLDPRMTNMHSEKNHWRSTDM